MRCPFSQAIGVEDLDDMGVVELGDGLGLAFEPDEEEVGVENFDDDEAIEAGVVGFVDFGHAAAPEALLQSVFAERPAGEVCHVGNYMEECSRHNA